MHESATTEQIAAAPPGTLTHRNYVCLSLHKERIKHAPPSLIYRAPQRTEGDLMLERALTKSIASIVPPPTHPRRAGHLQMDSQTTGGHYLRQSAL